jgi:hypothetical protein
VFFFHLSFAVNQLLEADFFIREVTLSSFSAMNLKFYVCWSLDLLQVPEYVPALDEEGICKMAFELIFAFDEVISLGHKENVTLGQVKQYVEMESHEERLHKLVIESKINDTKDVMKRKASEIDKNRVSCLSLLCFANYVGMELWRSACN